jgi:hypothetical protein
MTPGRIDVPGEAICRDCSGTRLCDTCWHRRLAVIATRLEMVAGTTGWPQRSNR